MIASGDVLLRSAPCPLPPRPLLLPLLPRPLLVKVPIVDSSVASVGG
jgi:hypothetical protein